MSSWRIGFDARYINDRYHGIGRYAFHLLEALVQRACEHTFVIFRGQGQETRFDWSGLASNPNVELAEGLWPLYWPQEQLRWPIILRQQRLDLFHSPYFVAPLWSRLPIIVTVHDLIFERYPQAMPLPWARGYYRSLMRLSLRRASQVATVSQASARDLRQVYAIDPQKILVAPEGADPHFAPLADATQRETLRRRYQLTRPFVLSVGARRPHKNLGRLVEAYASVHHSLHHDLVFVGSPDRRFPDEARSTAAQLQLNGRVHFIDWVPEADLPGLYSLAEVVVIPSLIEGFGLPALEALACGTPVIASKNTSLPEVVGAAGLLVDPLDPQDIARNLERLLNDAGLQQRLRQAGLEQARRFRWNDTADLLLAGYQALLEPLRS